MRPLRLPGVLSVSALLTTVCVLAGACNRDAVPNRGDSGSDTAAPGVLPVATTPSDWDAELGDLLLVPSDSDNSAIVIFPAQSDETLPASAAVTLVSPSGDTAQATVTRTDSLECGDAPMVRLGGASSGAWTVGTVGRSATLIRMDSIESLAPADSARLAADIARVASALPMPNGSRFGGLPFAVVDARRFDLDGRQYVVAHLARRLNQEAQPLEERTFVIAERAAGSNERYVVAYHQRSEGTEDTAEHFDVLAGMRGRRAPFLLIARDQLSSTKYEILERDATGAWRVRWSRTLGC